MASKSLTRVTLELGGNDAAVILEDAILDDTHLDRLYAAIFDTTGQICMNAKRVYVHRSRIDEVVDGLSARLEKAKIGYGLDADTTMGPLHQPRAEGVRRGAHAGGEGCGRQRAGVRRTARAATWRAATSCAPRSSSTPTRRCAS